MYKSETISSGVKYVDDWENDETIEDVIKKTANDVYEIEAHNLTKHQADGLRELFSSPFVQVLMNQEDFVTGSAPIWQTVTIEDGSFKIKETRDNKASVGFKFMMPKRNIQIF